MRLSDIPPIVRAAGSLLFIAAGVFLLYITWFDGDGDETGTATPEPTAVVQSPCPTDWTDFDNTATRFRICLPSNLVFSTGTSTIALRDADQADPRFANDFHVVNLAWLNPWPETIPTDPQLPPLRIAVRVPLADYGIEGCDLRGSPADADGVRSCSDLMFIRDGQAVLDPTGDFHRFRALVPAASPPGAMLFVQADSMTAAWTAQEPLVQQVLDSIRPY